MFFGVVVLVVKTFGCLYGGEYLLFYIFSFFIYVGFFFGFFWFSDERLVSGIVGVLGVWLVVVVGVWVVRFLNSLSVIFRVRVRNVWNLYFL